MNDVMANVEVTLSALRGMGETDLVRGTNYGIDRARFPSVVPVGAQVRMTGRLLAVSDRDDGGVRYKVSVEVRVVGADRPSLAAELLLLAYDS